jgi:hypothetical protein
MIVLFFNYAFEYAIRRVQVNQDCLKFNGTYQLLVYADVNKMGRSVHTIKKNKDGLIAASNRRGYKQMLIKRSTWSCVEIRTQD